jgi:hypothetical protein
MMNSTPTQAVVDFVHHEGELKRLTTEQLIYSGRAAGIPLDRRG